jgi:type II restriction/modification system DNA methylase subunit YeeA
MDETGGCYSASAKPKKWSEVIELSDSDKMRDRAARLYAMVLSAREHGFGSADYLAELANEALARADEMDRRGVS